MMMGSGQQTTWSTDSSGTASWSLSTPRGRSMNAGPSPPKKGPPKVELHVSCKKLADMDVFSKSDPMVVLYVPKAEFSNKWTEFGRTEMIKDTLNPKFVKSFVMEYHFEKIQKLLFKVYDIDHENAPLSKQDYIGYAVFRLGELMTAKGQTISRTLLNTEHPKRKNGDIIIYAEELNDPLTKQDLSNVDVRSKRVKLQRQYISFTFQGRKLDKKDLFGKSDPFFVVLKAREGGELVPVYKSETIKKTLNPNWKEFTMKALELNNGDDLRPITIQVWDWNRSGSHELIGSVTTDTKELLSKKEFGIIHPDKKQKKAKKKKHYSNSGTLIIEQAYSHAKEKVVENPYYGFNPHSFLEYIMGGCQINLIIAVDWTKSNGEPCRPYSLHHIDKSRQKPNDYMQAIKSVVSILSDYDSDKRYPVFGFGGKKKNKVVTSHCFELNGNKQDPEVFEIDGVLKAYKAAFNHWELSGPTNFAEIVDKAASFARDSVNKKQLSYYILLILTDGVISDMPATTRAIVEASSLPLSIVIVGIGNADFSKMEVLDADDKPLVHKGRPMERDIVQFVPFKDYKNHPERLAEETLMEIPWQLTSFMAVNGIAPPPIPYSSGAGPSSTSMYPSQQPIMMPLQQLQMYPQQQFNPSMSAGYQGGSMPQYTAVPMIPLPHGMQQQQPQPQNGAYFVPQQQQPPLQQAPMQQHNGYPSSGQSSVVMVPQSGYGAAPSQNGYPSQQQMSPRFMDAQQSSQMQQQPPQSLQHPQSQQPLASQSNATELDPQLYQLLERLGYLSFADVFLKERLTFEALTEFEREDMKELGLPAGPRIAIYRALHP
ncbi:Copine IVb [Balamuthia mandrillaris]